jgi:hypothetical protein
MIVIYENPVTKSRAVTLFDGWRLCAGEFGNTSLIQVLLQ